MSEVKTPAQLRAERRKQRILKGGSSRIEQLTGDRKPPSTEFAIRDPSAVASDPSDQLNDLLMSNRLSEPRLKNPYLPEPPPPAAAGMMPPMFGSPQGAIPALSSVAQISVILVLSLVCFLFRLNYGLAMVASVVAFLSLQYLNIRTFSAASPMLNFIPGKLQYVAKAAFFSYRKQVIPTIATTGEN